MNVLFVNACNYGSTGKIINHLCTLLVSKKEKCLFAVPKTTHNKNQLKENQVLFGGKICRNLSFLFNKLFGNTEKFNYFNTYCLIKIIKRFKPDIIHLHNVHGNYINISYFFSYIGNKKIKVIWTLHDCWSFTGRCPHFTISKCEKWKYGCNACPYPKKDYPISFIDRTKHSWAIKKKLFSSILNLTIVTPSNWLANLVKLSFLKDKNIKVINNGIDLSFFCRKKSSFRFINGLGSKYIILGVAFDWGYRKGLDVFVELSKVLDANYVIVLVGTNETIDECLPPNIVSIHRTQDQSELAEIFSAADVFLNPTREENYPTVNMEALACGCPVITFNTGGSPEIIDDKTGCVVPWDDIDEMEKQIIDICENHRYKREDCIKRAKSFDMNDRFKEYIELYKEMLKENV